MGLTLNRGPGTLERTSPLHLLSNNGSNWKRAVRIDERNSKGLCPSWSKRVLGTLLLGGWKEAKTTRSIWWVSVQGSSALGFFTLPRGH